MQKALDDRIISERSIDKTVDEWVIGITLAMESEIDEIRREVNWKWWKNPKPVDSEALQGEVIDMWHFLVSLSDKVGLTADDVYAVYCEKNAENHARQDGTSAKEGYGVTAEETDTYNADDYRTFECENCGDLVTEERGTFAEDNNMCAECWCAYQGG